MARPDGKPLGGMTQHELDIPIHDGRSVLELLAAQAPCNPSIQAWVKVAAAA